VLTIRAGVESQDVQSFTADALREIRRHIERHHLEVEGPPFSNCRPQPHHRYDVEVGWPVSHASGAGRIHAAAFPRSPAGSPG
jgi:hypothetical protein